MIVNKLSSLLPQLTTENSVENIHTDVGMLRVNPSPARSTKAIMSATTTTTKDMAIVMIMRITTTTTTTTTITITNLPKIY